jgi:hypothetical protein
MATGAAQPDFDAQLDSMLLGSYIDRMYDARFTRDEQLRFRLALEHLLLTFGRAGIRRIERAFNVSDTQLAERAHSAEWFMTFVSSLPGDLLREVGLPTIERFWRFIPDERTARHAIEVIARIEVANDIPESYAHTSLLVSRFRESQPNAFAQPLADNADLIARTLLARVRITPLPVLASDQGRLSRYCLAVVRFCFANQYQALSPEQMDYVVGLVGEVSAGQKQRIYQGLV